MSSGVPGNPYRRSISFTSGALAVVNAIKTSFATVAAPVVLVPADFNGSGVSSVNGVISGGVARTVTISRSNAASQYSVSPIVITGKYGGSIVIESLTPGNVNGNDVLRGTQAFTEIVSISIPTQGGTGGSFQIGVQDIVAQKGDTFTGVELAAAGTINVQYGEGPGSPTDAIPIATALVGFIKPIAPTRILTNPGLSSPTTVGLTVYLP